MVVWQYKHISWHINSIAIENLTIIVYMCVYILARIWIGKVKSWQYVGGGHQHAFPNTCLSLRLARKTVANFNATTTMAQQHAIHNSEGWKHSSIDIWHTYTFKP